MKNAKYRIDKRLFRLAVLGICLAPCTQVFAQDLAASSNLKFSGYVSLVGGKVLSGNLDANYAGPTEVKGVNCPCYVADWGNAGVYGKEFTLTPESRIGIQGKYTINNKTSVTARTVWLGGHQLQRCQCALQPQHGRNQLDRQLVYRSGEG